MKNKKRQQKAQSRQANALHRQQERVARNIRLVERAEKRWQQTQSLLTQLGAILQQAEEEQKGVLRVVYLVTYKGQTQTLRSQSGVRRWIKHIRHPAQEEMSWAERHVWWMILATPGQNRSVLEKGAERVCLRYPKIAQEVLQCFLVQVLILPVRKVSSLRGG